MGIQSRLTPSGNAPTILMVDDEPINLEQLGSLLQPNYRVFAARSAEQALKIAARPPQPNLILLDVVMPGMGGYAALTRLRDDPATRDIPVILLTTLSDSSSEELGFELGAADFIAKPVKHGVLLGRIKLQLEAKQARDLLADLNTGLEAEVRRRAAENDEVRLLTIRALAHMVEMRDPETGRHLVRTQHYIAILANKLRQNPRYAAALSDRYVRMLIDSAPLHDIGKVGIPDAILLKKGRLTEAEMVVMRRHAAMGRAAIESAEQDVHRKVEFLAIAKEVANWHHEWWDGRGYPDGLKGDQIPISARLMAVADVFDAANSRRVYKSAISIQGTCDLIRAGRGSQFDPDVVDAFDASFAEFEAVARRYAD